MIYIGKISDRELNKKIRRKMCKPSFRMKSKKDYRREKRVDEKE